jgi:flagellar basal-body rod protein FlgG
MIRGLYTAASGMIAQQKRHENVSNNIANIETPSFKKQTMMVTAGAAREIFKDSENHKTSLGMIELGVGIDGVTTDFSQGLLRETGRPEDLAINGQGYFRTELLSGQAAYTRNGSFERDSDGFMRNTDGYCLYGKKAAGGQVEPIKLETATFSVEGDGNILDSEGKILYTMSLVDFKDLSLLKEVVAGVYTFSEGAVDNEISAENARIVSGMKEASNVNALDEMVKLMEISRSFESNQRVIQSLDETLGKAVNEIGRL